MHLKADAGQLASQIGGPGLGERRQQRGPFRGLLALVVGPVGGAVDGFGVAVGESAHRAGGGPHVQQHPPNVGMVDYRRRLGGGRSGRAALAALVGVGEGLLVGPLGDGHPLQADAQAGVVHHREHGPHPAVLLADEEPHRAVVVAVGHHAGGTGMDPQLVLDRHAAHVVAGAGRPVGGRQVLGHQEAADPPGPRRCVGRAGQHQVNDVVGEVVLAVGDEDLGSVQPVRAVGLGHGPGGDRPEVGPGLGLGEVHGAGPVTGDHPRQVEGLLLVGSVRAQHVDGALGEQRAQRP